MTALRIHVAGASGGVGATVLAVALALRAAARGARSAVVERTRGGLDIVAAVDGWPGVRLDDLAELDGRLDGERLMASLPRSGGAAVLAFAGDRRGAALPAAIGDAVEDALATAGDVLVIDAGPSPQVADVLVVGAAAHQLARARSVAAPGALLAFAADGLDADEVAHRLGLRGAVSVPRDRGVDRALASGVAPGAGRRGLGGAADVLLDRLGLGVGPTPARADGPRGAVR